jgi:hypothetical protein
MPGRVQPCTAAALEPGREAEGNPKAEIDKWWPIIRAANIKAE